MFEESVHKSGLFQHTQFLKLKKAWSILLHAKSVRSATLFFKRRSSVGAIIRDELNFISFSHGSKTDDTSGSSPL